MLHNIIKPYESMTNAYLSCLWCVRVYVFSQSYFFEANNFMFDYYFLMNHANFTIVSDTAMLRLTQTIGDRATLYFFTRPCTLACRVKRHATCYPSLPFS